MRRMREDVPKSEGENSQLDTLKTLLDAHAGGGRKSKHHSDGLVEVLSVD